MRDFAIKILKSGALLPLFVLFFWWYGAAAGWWNTFLLPSPGAVWRAFVSSLADGTLQENTWASLSRIAVGFGLSALLALLLALLCSSFPPLLAQLDPTLEFLRHIPPMAVIPMLILWFGIGESPKIILIILALSLIHI